MTSNTTPKRRYMVVDARTGAHVRAATSAERTAYRARYVGDGGALRINSRESVVTYYGPGASHVPGRFLESVPYALEPERIHLGGAEARAGASLAAKAGPCASKRGRFDWLAVETCATGVAPKGPRINSSATVVDVVMKAASLEARQTEHFLVLCLNAKHEVIAVSTVSKGGIEAAEFDPRVVLQLVMLAGAPALIVVHNHPSGDPQPSRDDMLVTQRLREACKLVGLRLLDHVIIAFRDFGDERPRSFSFLDSGLMVAGAGDRG